MFEHLFIEQLLDDLEPHKQHRESINIHHGSLIMVTVRTNVPDAAAGNLLPRIKASPSFTVSK